MGVVALVFLLGITNLGLGFGLAVLLRWHVEGSIARVVASPMDVPVEAAPPGSNATTDVAHIDEATETLPGLPPLARFVAPPELPKTEDIPQEWLDIIGELAQPQTFVEAAVHVLRLEVGRYRDQLARFDLQARQFLADENLESLASCLQGMRRVNEEWLTVQSDAARHLRERNGQMGALASVGNGLEETLMAQAAQIESTCSNIEHLNFKQDLQRASRRLYQEICLLLDMAHALRDRMQDALLAIMHQERRIDSLHKRLQVDGLTGLVNRAGLEVYLTQWWRDDPTRIRQVSLALVDLDRFSSYNLAYGAGVADLLLLQFGKLVAEAVDKSRGVEIAVRFDGQRFAILFGDTGPQNATSSVERLRQTLEATRFEFGGIELAISISAGVIEILNADTCTTAMERLANCVRESKKAGRNRTYQDKGQGPVATQPPTFQVPMRNVALA